MELKTAFKGYLGRHHNNISGFSFRTFILEEMLVDVDQALSRQHALHSGGRFTVRMLTHVLCKATHFFPFSFQLFVTTMHNSLQTSFNCVKKMG